MQGDYLKLYQYAFYASALLFVYGILLPFDFAISPESIAQASARLHLLPYWDCGRQRIHSIPDIVQNILLTLPLGYFGYAWFEQKRTWLQVWKWGFIGLGLGLAAELIQLGIPSRLTSVTDAINNGCGAWVGAAAARLVGPSILAVITGRWTNRGGTLILLMLCSLIVTTLGPFDLTLDVSNFEAGLNILWTDPWESHTPIAHEWIMTVEFAVFGALAAKFVCPRHLLSPLSLALGIVAVLAVPVTLELGQLFVISHAPSVRDMFMGFIGVGAGLICGLYWPELARPTTGLVLLTLAMIAAGLSPYQFTFWGRHLDFEWIPLYEYYTHTTLGALYDAAAGVFNFVLFAILLKASWHCPLWVLMAVVMGLAGGIELMQAVSPTRYAGITDVIMACLGAWTGDYIWTILESTDAQ